MTYHEVTKRPVSVGVMEFVDRLENDFGEDRVEAAIRAEGHRGDFGKILGRVSDRLALEDQRFRARQQPLVELSGPSLMDVVRGTAQVSPPFTYDSRGLSSEEYTEVLAWAARRREFIG